MSRPFQGFCRSAPWRFVAGRVVLPWAVRGEALAGEVLELGCGSGAMAAAVLERFPSARITATDYDPSMVAAATRRLAPFGDRAAVRSADATALPFEDASFDAVLSFLMLHHVGRWEEALTEVARVLRPGGRFVGFDLGGDGAARLVNGHDRGTRLVRIRALRRVMREAGLDGEATPALGGLATRFAARRR